MFADWSVTDVSLLNKSLPPGRSGNVPVDGSFFPLIVGAAARLDGLLRRVLVQQPQSQVKVQDSASWISSPVIKGIIRSEV